MILIGQYDSPFVRRVGVALQLYGMAYEHRPWSTFSDGERIAPFNPLRRVPTLILDTDEVLIESFAILDHLDAQAGPQAALIAADGPQRRGTLKLAALATGLCDKMVSLIYERALHDQTSALWIARCEGQIGAVLDVLETDRVTRTTAFWFGDRITHGDVAVGCAMRFMGEAHPAIARLGRWPALVAHAQKCEQLDAFAAVVQAFIPPK